MAESDAGGRRDDFDDIVDRLGMDLEFPEGHVGAGRAPGPAPQEPELPPELDDLPDDRDEQFYRRVPARAPGPVHRGRALAWTGLLGSPMLLVIATLTGSWLSSAVLLGAGLTFVASAIYLISQLPEHGPSQRDWPDDGAAL